MTKQNISIILLTTTLKLGQNSTGTFEDYTSGEAVQNIGIYAQTNNDNWKEYLDKAMTH